MFFHQVGDFFTLGLVRKTRIVFNFVGIGGQAADQGFFEQDGLETGATGIDGGGQAGGTTADDADIVLFNFFLAGHVTSSGVWAGTLTGPLPAFICYMKYLTRSLLPTMAPRKRKMPKTQPDREREAMPL